MLLLLIGLFQKKIHTCPTDGILEILKEGRIKGYENPGRDVAHKRSSLGVILQEG